MSLSSSLPADILLVMLTHLDPKDVLNIRKTCKNFYGLSKSRSVWDALLRRCILEQDIPLPGLAGRSLESLDADELEVLLRRALELRRNWHSDAPVIRRSFQLVRSSGSGRIVQMGVFPSDHARWLVTLSGLYGRHGTVSTVRCWDLRRAHDDDGHPVCVAEKEFERFGGMAINNKNNTGEGDDCIAVLTPRGIEILTLVGNATHPKEGFVTSKTISVPMSKLHYFQGRRVVTSDSQRRLFLLDIDHPQIKIEFQHSSLSGCRAFVVTDTFILVLKRATLELYPLPSSMGAVPAHIIIPPIFAYQWPWPVDFGAMTLRPRFGTRCVNDPITMFVRFGVQSYPPVPWSNNSIHQYEIRPNSYFVSCELPSEMNVPYEYPPVLAGTIAAPVRMAKPTDLVLGAHGTAVWLDSHAEMYYHRSGGQRVAGAFARVERGDLDREEDHQDSSSFDSSESREAAFVFAHQPDESWDRLAIDEEEGVIFVGRNTGVIDMFKYGT